MASTKEYFLNTSLFVVFFTNDEDVVVNCFKCGIEGHYHYANSCYASKHIKGYHLR